ncbi:MAG: DNA-protecting protein DprA [Holophagae bacterium]|nr:MAG: DNA-protecting protein DprA [Holophagae bacterium]
MVSYDTGTARCARLALLLAGVGARCRRLLAADSCPGGPLEALVRGGAPAAVAGAAARLLRETVPDLLAKLEGIGWRWLVPADAEYPERLRSTADPPLGLFVRGRLAAGPAVAIVGSRAATPYGRQVARLLGEQLGRAGVVVVSGMARGVDACAHEGALAAGGPTWAVWGSGPDQIYPPEHGRLAEAIAAAGALLSEYPPGTPPRRHHFPERNRLIAGLADATVVVEAAAGSGALGTARQAVEEGREVFAVPGGIFSELSVGPNTLLRLGARPLLTACDVLEVVAPGAARAVDPKAGRPDDGWLLARLPAGTARTVDELAAEASVALPVLLPELLQLELAGVVERLPDGRFARRSGNGAS